MKIVIILGPPAVGKITVGQKLEEITNLKLFHNHMSIELVNKFFDFGTEAFERLDKVIRFEIFNLPDCAIGRQVQFVVASFEKFLFNLNSLKVA